MTVSFGYKETILQEGVTLVDLSDAQITMSEDQVTLDVTADVINTDMMTKLSSLKAGDVVVSSSGSGFLRKVISVQKVSESNYVITSGDASLEEVIAQGTAAFSKQMTYGDLAEDVKRRSRTGPFDDNGFNLIPSDDPNDTVFRLAIGSTQARSNLSGELRWPTDDAKIVLKGSLDVSIKVDFGVEMELWPPGVGYVRFIPEIDAEESLDLSVIAEVDAKYEIPIGKLLKFSPMTFFIGPVPVVVTPEVQLVLGVKATASGEVTAGIELKQTAKCGFIYNRNTGVESVADFYHSNTFTPPTAIASAEVQGYVQVKPVLYLWGITGPAVKLKGYIKVKGEAENPVFSDDPCSGGLNFTAYAGRQYGFEWDLGAAKKLGKWAEDVKLEVNFKPEEYVLKIWNVEGFCDSRPAFMEVAGLDVNQFVAEVSGEIVSQVYTITNTGDLEMDWEVRYLMDGITSVSPTNGKLTAGESATVTATVNAGVLGIGQYGNELKFINKHDGGLLDSYPTGSTRRMISITVVSPDDPVLQRDGFTNSLGMTFVKIPAGTFMMGSPEDELGAEENEWPQHQVTLSQDFYIMTTEVTQAQWETVMESNPSSFSSCGGDCPVESLSWNDIQDFIAALNAMGGRTYRLPTEAEWEYAARAGTTTAFYSGDITETIFGLDLDPNLDAIGWYCGNAGELVNVGCTDCTTHPVAQKQPNAYGLYDMSGNVDEWVQDWYGNYPDNAVINPEGPDTGTYRVIRGGYWLDGAQNCRSASRSGVSPSYRHSFQGGFRLVLLQ